MAGAPIPQPSARPLTSTELGLKAAGLFEVGLLSEGAECLIRILDLDESQDDLFLCYERVASLLEQFKFSSPGWGAGVGAVLLCGLAPGRAFIKGPVSGFAEALHALEEISSTNALHPGALEMKARLLLIAGQYKEALPAFRLAIASGHGDETRRIKLVTLPLHQAGIWKREFKKQPDAGTHIAQCTWLAANLGHRHAQCDLGFMHMAGKGMEQSMFQAFVWFMLAARAGESRAVAPLEEVYTFLQKDEYFQLDAKRPSALAQAKHNLGAAYYFGNGTEQNYPEAANWFREAAEMGSADSKYNLGLMYKNGQGVEKDLVLAYVWLHRAALQGDPDASAMRDAVAAAMSPDQVATASVLVERQN